MHGFACNINSKLFCAQANPSLCKDAQSFKPVRRGRLPHVVSSTAVSRIFVVSRSAQVYSSCILEYNVYSSTQSILNIWVYTPKLELDGNSPTNLNLGRSKSIHHLLKLAELGEVTSLIKTRTNHSYPQLFYTDEVTRNSSAPSQLSY